MRRADARALFPLLLLGSLSLLTFRFDIAAIRSGIDGRFDVGEFRIPRHLVIERAGLGEQITFSRRTNTTGETADRQASVSSSARMQ